MTEGQRLWNLVKDLTDTLYSTHPSERLGLCEPIIAEEFPEMQPRTVRSVSNTILRLVAWMSEQDNMEKVEAEPESDIDYDELTYLYEVEEMSGPKIAELLDIPQGSINKFLHDAGVSMRSQSEAQKLVDNSHLTGSRGER